MIATTLPEWATADGLLVFAAVLVGLGFLVGQWRVGRLRGANEALELQQKELEVLDGSNKRLEAELEKYRSEVNILRGAVDQLRDENRELRALLMGDKVQPALFEAMTSVARATASELREKLEADVAAVLRSEDPRLERIEQALARLLTAKDEERDGPRSASTRRAPARRRET